MDPLLLHMSLLSFGFWGEGLFFTWVEKLGFLSPVFLFVLQLRCISTRTTPRVQLLGECRKKRYGLEVVTFFCLQVRLL